jgi:hypothetical protein
MWRITRPQGGKEEMSIDAKIEEEAYRAVNTVCAMIWPKQRERILKAIIVGIMVFMKWETVTLKKDGEHE